MKSATSVRARRVVTYFSTVTAFVVQLPLNKTDGWHLVLLSVPTNFPTKCVIIWFTVEKKIVENEVNEKKECYEN